MACDFSIKHYEEILETAKRLGYGFCDFTGKRRTPGKKLYLRHDVDLSLAMALEIARVDHALGVSSTFFVLNECDFYSILDGETIDQVKSISDLGHDVGLHIDVRDTVSRGADLEEFVSRSIELFKTFLPVEDVVAFHNPDPEILHLEFRRFSCTYEPRFFSNIEYISDSARNWRGECACSRLERAKGDVQLLLHPFWWVAGSDFMSAGASVLADEIRHTKLVLAKNAPPIGVLDIGAEA